MEENNREIFLQEIAAFLGVPKIELNDAGFCEFVVQEENLLVVRVDEKSERLTLMVDLGTPERISGELFGAILSFNAHKVNGPGAWIFLEKEGTFFLMDEFFIQTLSLEEFKTRFVEFLDHYLTYQGLFTESDVNQIVPEVPPEREELAFENLRRVA